MINKLKLLTGIRDDAIANLYIEMATQSILDYTNRKELLKEMEMLVVELASFSYTNKDKEGINSRSEGAISETYTDLGSSDGIPASIKARLGRYKLLHIVKHKE